MAIFKVGQRVKWVRNNPAYCDDLPIGTIGTIAAPFGHIQPGEVSVIVDNPPFGSPWRFAYPWQLAPLTDPKVDAFIEGLKRLRYEEPKAPRPEALPVRELDKYWGGSQ